jgi:hypothetical protein
VTEQPTTKGVTVNFLLWIAAIILAVLGILSLLSGSILWGVLLLILAALVGPGGYTIVGRRA